MNAVLNDTEVRVVGSLIEKQVTTPEYYPLTLNALLHACNQISNRDPVVSYDEKTVALALESLRDKNLVYVFYGADSRVPKYKQMMTEIFHVTPAEMAVMCVLMLRGPQTIGELRGRTSRLYDFPDLAEVEATLEKLMTHEDEEPLVTRLSRQTGQKEARYAHLLTGQVPVVEAAAPVQREPAKRDVRADNDRVTKLEAEVEALRRETADLKQQFVEFKKQFE